MPDTRKPGSNARTLQARSETTVFVVVSVDIAVCVEKAGVVVAVVDVVDAEQ